MLVGCGLLFRSVMMVISNSLELKHYGELAWGKLLTLGICAIYFSLIVRKLHYISSGIPMDLKRKFHQIQREIQEELTAE